MLCLNIRSTYTRIGERTTQWANLDMRYRQADLDVDVQPAKVGVHPSHPTIECDSTACQAAIGNKQLSQVIKESEQKGFSNVTSFIKRHNSLTEQFLKSGAKRDVVVDAERSKLFQHSAKAYGVSIVPNVKFTVKNNDKVDGTNTPGTADVTITPHPVELQGTPAKVETYVQQQGDVRMWTSEGKYDIYA